jgi:biotin-dependent carboxylase-like uncharacterized protein
MSILHVVDPGLLTTVQDPRGRPGYGRYGVPSGGALDPFAAEAANQLVGNAWDAAVLEITLLGPTLRVDGGVIVIGLAGADLGACIDGKAIQPGWSWLLRAGALLEFADRAPETGARAYLAVAGGIQVPSVLGSPSTELRAGFGGLSGRALRAGDRLEVGDVSDLIARCGRHLSGTPIDPAEPVRLLPGPHVERFEPGALGTLCSTEWRIADGADRMGYRLLGPPFRHRAAADVASLGLPVGAIQVPGDGQPIVLLADHQPTGGYTVLACVIRADLGILAQRRPGDSLRFELTTPDTARAALLDRRGALSNVIEPLRWT